MIFDAISINIYQTHLRKRYQACQKSKTAILIQVFMKQQLM